MKIEGISDDIRQTAHRLHPSVVENLGLPAALRSLCADFSKQEGMQVSCRQRDIIEGSIPPLVGLCLYRVAQEALRNVARHSGARRATLVLARAGNELRLSVNDTGSGFDPAVLKARKTLGLLSMEERVRLADGKLIIRSSPGKGTRLLATVPLPEKTP
jgi:signal transduction histidine kinase